MITGEIYIPARILSIKGLSSRAKILYGVVVTRSVSNGFCGDTDQELSEGMRLSVRTLRNHLSALERHGLIEVKTVSGERRLYPNEDLESLRKFIKERRFYA